MARLHLLDTTDLPPSRMGLSNVRARLCPNSRYLGVLSFKVLLRVYTSAGGRLVEAFAHPLPPSSLDFAIHPDGDRIAIATRDQIQIIFHETGSVALHPIDPRWGEVRALLFSRDGRILWISAEGRGGLNQVHALDSATLDLMDTATVLGLEGSHHSLTHHPSEEAVAVEVSCGQEGTWISFVRCKEGRVQPVGPGLAFRSAPLFMVGWMPHGRAFIGITESDVRTWSWPLCEPLTGFSFRQAGWMLGWRGAALKDQVIVSVSDLEEESFRLLELDGDTMCLLGEHAWLQADQSYLIGIYTLCSDHLVLLADRRIGLFTVEAALP